MSEVIAILDFGSQYTQLIARRIRELGVYTAILPADTTAEALKKMPLKGIVLSGGPGSVAKRAELFDVDVLGLTQPILGICFGMQLMNHLHEGKVETLPRGEYGKHHIYLEKESLLFCQIEKKAQVWMSHGESVSHLAPCYHSIAKSDEGTIAAIAHETLPHFGLQFHPEVTHTPQGKQLLENFLDLCGCEKSWSVETYIEETVEKIRAQVGDGRVVSLVSGGVDSTAATSLCFEALGKERVFPLHIDTGLMRAGESAEVKELMKEYELTFVDASEEFLSALKGITEPEKKREIIGHLFIEILQREIAKLESHSKPTYFCQGTLYTDLIESGKGCGDQAVVIKSHHNVNPPIVEEKRKAGLIIEPNAEIFKDEVREVCVALGIPDSLTWRHPFPGPGLAIRILGEVTPERVATLQQADKIFTDEIKAAGLYREIWQAFAVLIPAKTVGVMGDQRTEGSVIALRAVNSIDGMTAEVSQIPYTILERISTRITNEVPAVNRVTYDITSKPPATIEWE